MSGYVRIYRTLLGHHAFRNDGEAMAFAWMVLRASWKPTKVRYKERIIALERGQLSVSQRDMASALDRDKAWVERFWKRLKNEAMIEAVVKAGVAVITICNYDDFQASRGSDEALSEAVSEAGARQGRGTEQRREEIKEVLEDSIMPLEPSHSLAKASETIRSEWNLMASRTGGVLKQAIAMSAARKAHLKARLKEMTVEEIVQTIHMIPQSRFLTGGNKDGWTADLGWVLERPDALLKISEGTYNDRPAGQNNGQAHRGAGGQGDRRSTLARVIDEGLGFLDGH